MAAFAVRDRAGSRHDLMALEVPRGAAPRPHPLASLSSASIAGLAMPVAHGAAAATDGSAAQFVICRVPGGAPLGKSATIARPWSEAELIACVLRPIAAVLAELEARRVTHRAIRPDNVFQSEPGQPVVLGAAWAAPPASLQPAAFEPPYVACCLEAGRGEGGVADDVYALGVLLLALSVGRMPLAGLEPAEIVRRKLSDGSHAVLVGDLHPPQAIAELVRGMLAEDPEHRPTPARLADPGAVRSRRLAVRPPRHAQRLLDIEGHAVGNARALAGALAASPVAGVRLLRQGAVDHWLRRELADPTLAMRVEEAVRARAGDSQDDEAAADGLLLVRTVATLDPLAPVCGGGVALWPDGLGAALLAADPARSEILCRLVASEAIAAWAAARPDRCDPAALRLDVRQHHALLIRRGWAGGALLLRYALNPLAPCASALLAGRMVTRLPDLLAALEEVAARSEGRPALPLDADAAAFIVARQDLRTDRDIAALGDGPRRRAASVPGMEAVAQVRVLARLQTRLQTGPLPKLAGWLAGEVRPALAVWQSRARRTRMEAALDGRAASGQLAALLELVDDETARAQDHREAEAARAALARIASDMAGLQDMRERRARRAHHVAQEMAAALGVMALSCVAMWLAL